MKKLKLNLNDIDNEYFRKLLRRFEQTSNELYYKKKIMKLLDFDDDIEELTENYKESMHRIVNYVTKRI